VRHRRHQSPRRSDLNLEPAARLSVPRSIGSETRPPKNAEGVTRHSPGLTRNALGVLGPGINPRCTGQASCYASRVSVHAHREQGPCHVDCGVITVSDTRTEETDGSGRLIQELLREHGHRIGMYRIVKDEPDLITKILREAPKDVAAIICNGGTGLAARDTTYEAVRALLNKEIAGFGELFRRLSYEEIGAAAMLSRATAGVVGDRVIFSVPGSSAAVELAMTKLILPELGHVVGLVRPEA